MQRHYSLAYLTAPTATAAQAIDVAAELGYSYVGLRPFPNGPGAPFQPMLDDAVALRETLARMRDTGVRVFDIEIIRIGEGFDALAYAPALALGAEIGAKAVLIAADDTDEARLAANYARLCEVAQPFGLTCDLEFMPWTAVKNAPAARRIVELAGQPENAGVLVDSLHFGRSASTLDDIARLPRKWLHYAQISDAPAGIPATDEALIRTARCDRLLPGEGGIDLAGLFAVLPYDLPVSVEIPNEVRARALGLKTWSAQALAASRALIETGRPE
ncbi:sugar phosphate isomerase/epimerase family protein [Cupriavidus sp. TMH.W2]|uniref:sugar phosphate isomerase/epimerase family protein n=1 Tax=Cupriavidus sp. TMH.W2 TaxID=3434465 RepID=UPI003D7859DD